MSAMTVTNFYRCTIESILSGCITAWYDSCSAQDHKELQKVVNVAQSITQTSLPSIDSVYTSRCLGKAASIIKDPTHPGHSRFSEAAGSVDGVNGWEAGLRNGLGFIHDPL